MKAKIKTEELKKFLSEHDEVFIEALVDPDDEKIGNDRIVLYPIRDGLPNARLGLYILLGE